MFGVPALQPAHGVDGETRALALLEIADENAGTLCHALGGSEPSVERRHVLRPSFQRIARRDQPPHLVETERAQGLETDVSVPAMGRVERAAEETDARHHRERLARTSRSA